MIKKKGRVCIKPALMNAVDRQSFLRTPPWEEVDGEEELPDGKPRYEGVEGEDEPPEGKPRYEGVGGELGKLREDPEWERT
jgi:hypothetical protein